MSDIIICHRSQVATQKSVVAVRWLVPACLFPLGYYRVVLRSATSTTKLLRRLSPTHTQNTTQQNTTQFDCCTRYESSPCGGVGGGGRAWVLSFWWQVVALRALVRKRSLYGPVTSAVTTPAPANEADDAAGIVATVTEITSRKVTVTHRWTTVFLMSEFFFFFLLFFLSDCITWLWKSFVSLPLPLSWLVSQLIQLWIS